MVYLKIYVFYQQNFVSNNHTSKETDKAETVRANSQVEGSAET